jgi:tRNA pseudouridine55 synthase
MFDGLLLIDKPEGWTSFDVVAKVRSIIKAASKQSLTSRAPNMTPKKVKVGHIGTLDPAATGLLVLAMGSYTKKVPELIKQDKTYEVTLTLGKVSNTGDKEGAITDTSTKQPYEQDILAALKHFTGEYMQTPPAFSAIKVNGKRAYDLARKGKEVTIAPRPIIIYSNKLDCYEYPLVKFTSHVGSGTYIRSLVEDIGTELGTGAYMSDLRRTRIGKYNIINALALDSLNAQNVLTNIITDLK